MEFKKLIREFSEKLECAICGEIVTTPKTLPCLHSFCENCITSWWRRCQENHQPFQCPECRSVIELPNGISHLRSSFYLDGMLELFTAFTATVSSQESRKTVCGSCEKASVVAAFCSNCSDLLCASCVEIHRQIKVSRNHRIVLLRKFQSVDVQDFLQRPMYCKEENHERKELEYFCKSETCRKCVCQKCVSLKDMHKKHDYTSIEKAAEEAKAAMIEQAERVKKAVTSCHALLNSSQNELADIQKELDLARREVHESVETAIHKLRKHEAEVMAKIDLVENKQVTSQKVLQEDLELKIGELSSYVDNVDGIVNRNLKTEVLQTQSTTAQRAQELLVTHQNQKPQLRERPSVYYKTSDNVHEALNVGKLVISSCAGMGWVKALYAYTARNDKEISLQKNSKILILNKDADWWKGECDGQVGYFPSNYVEPWKE